MPNISRAVLNALMPKGAIWDAAPSGGLDLLLDGNAESKEILLAAINDLARIQIAELTTYLVDMEKEYGLSINLSLSEAERRIRLKNALTDNQGYGTAWDMQAKLRAAGFDNIYVYQNDPPVNMNQYLLDSWNVTTGHTQATCGNPNATCATLGGELVVNGEIYFGGILVTYAIPLVQYWHNVFFVGGEATIDSVNRYYTTSGNYNSSCGNPGATCGRTIDRDEIIDIPQVEIPFSRREEIKRLIVKYKPIHAWCTLLVTYI